jgi:DNA segregation ATPase FtsK/SpoIIIE-like protein
MIKEYLLGQAKRILRESAGNYLRRFRLSRKQKALDKLIAKAMRRSLTADIEAAFERTDAYVWLLKAKSEASVSQEVTRIQNACADAVKRRNHEEKVIVLVDPLRVEIQKERPDKVYLTDWKPGKASHFTFSPGVRQRVSDHVVHTMSLDDPEAAHILIAGATGSGKTVLAVNILTTSAMTTPPNKLALLVIDPKAVDIGNTAIAGLPHLAHPVITDAALGVTAIYRLAEEMRNRKAAINEHTVRGQRWAIPFRIFCYVDEVGDLVENDSQVIDAFNWIVAQGRGLGIHLCLATQRPTVDVIAGGIRANLTARFVGWVRGADESRIAAGLPGTGCEDLQGSGMFNLFTRSQKSIQSYYVDLDKDLPGLVDRIKTLHKASKAAWRISNLSPTEDMPEVIVEEIKAEKEKEESSHLYTTVKERMMKGEKFSLNALDKLRQELEGKTLGRKQAKELLERIKEEINAN